MHAHKHTCQLAYRTRQKDSNHADTERDKDRRTTEELRADRGTGHSDTWMETDRQTDRQTVRQTDRQSDRQTDRKI